MKNTKTKLLVAAALLAAPLAETAYGVQLEITNIQTRGAGCQYGNAGYKYTGVVDIVNQERFSIASFTFDVDGAGSHLKFLALDYNNETKTDPEDTSVFTSCKIQFDLASVKRGQKFSLRFQKIKNRYRWDDETGLFNAVSNVRLTERGRPEGSRTATFEAEDRGRDESAFFAYSPDFTTTCSETMTLKVDYNATLLTGLNGVKEESRFMYQDVGDLTAQIEECRE